MNPLFWPILIPAAASLVVLLVRNNGLRAAIASVAAIGNLLVVISLFSAVRDAAGKLAPVSYRWVTGIDFVLRLDNLGAFILLAAAGFVLLVTLYSWRFMEKHPRAGQFYIYMLASVAMVNGAVMADHLVVMLFFWEGLLATLFGMIVIGQAGDSTLAWKSATKALIIAGLCDLAMMMGIALVKVVSPDSMQMSYLAGHHLPAQGLGAAAFIFLMIGAISKAGSMPFHTWIPDAAVDAPLPFMAFLPASLEKLLGIYFLTRITQDIFELSKDHWLSPLMMIIGAATILLAVAMALIQKDYKRLLSYHAISQVGYMILGIGTCLPIGIIGGVFHMINHAMYKSCLFLTAGSVEYQAGTTDLRKLGGLGGSMKITFLCFIVAAASISGFPLTNGFYSKEMIYHAALDRNVVFYIAAALGTVLTAASFLKLGHAAFLGKREAASQQVTKDSPILMTLPMVVLAAGCLFFGLFNSVPLHQLLGPGLEVFKDVEHEVGGVLPVGTIGWALTGGTVLAIAIALVNHLAGVKRTGKGIGAVDHIHHAPVLATIYDLAEKGVFDPYNWITAVTTAAGHVGYAVNWLNDALYEWVSVGFAKLLSWSLRRANTGSYSMYVVWSLVGAAALIWYLLK